jgi:DNA-binding NarL/FixJ family response regulator
VVTPSPSATRVLILEDHILFAESLDLALTMDGYDVQLLSAAEREAPQGAVLSTIARLRPRIVILDLDLGTLGDGVRFIAPLERLGALVVVVTASADEGRWGECLVHGARTVLSKARPLSEIRATVRHLTQGRPVLDRQEHGRLVATWHNQRQTHADLFVRLERLSRRERQVLGHLMAGDAVREISRLGVVSEATVRTQVKSILSKLEVSSQLAAVGLAHKVGWRPPCA